MFFRWVVIREEFRPFLWDSPLNGEPFVLYMEELERAMGSTDGLLVRADAAMNEFFYNKTETAFADVRVVSPRLKLAFVGAQPFAFKPGMRFDAAVSVRLTYFFFQRNA